MVVVMAARVIKMKVGDQNPSDPFLVFACGVTPFTSAEPAVVKFVLVS